MLRAASCISASSKTNAVARMPRGGEAPSPRVRSRPFVSGSIKGLNGNHIGRFIPPERSPLPPVTDADWVRNPIDRFVLAQLEAEGSAPSEEADRITLLRPCDVRPDGITADRRGNYRVA
ncbi:MAG: hypothetical protein Ct9H300mP25_10330 [Acidobacteriota bacterium]|nr:MAG: hypothetical protein Ct9H300mP25_10330 [Acidobacteriota bacterium]